MQSTPSPFPTRIELRGEGLALRDWTEVEALAMPGLSDIAFDPPRTAIESREIDLD